MPRPHYSPGKRLLQVLDVSAGLDAPEENRIAISRPFSPYFVGISNELCEFILLHVVGNVKQKQTFRADGFPLF
jgi:hypothetical protein